MPREIYFLHHIPVGLAKRQLVKIVVRLTESGTLRALVQVTVLVTMAMEALVNGALAGFKVIVNER